MRFSKDSHQLRRTRYILLLQSFHGFGCRAVVVVEVLVTVVVQVVVVNSIIIISSSSSSRRSSSLGVCPLIS